MNQYRIASLVIAVIWLFVVAHDKDSSKRDVGCVGVGTAVGYFMAYRDERSGKRDLEKRSNLG